MPVTVDDADVARSSNPASVESEMGVSLVETAGVLEMYAEVFREPSESVEVTPEDVSAVRVPLKGKATELATPFRVLTSLKLCSSVACAEEVEAAGSEDPEVVAGSMPGNPTPLE